MQGANPCRDNLNRTLTTLIHTGTQQKERIFCVGIYIKDMAMPEICNECPLFNEDEGKCKITGKNVPWVWKYPDDYQCNDQIYLIQNWCPLVKVPPHGDLIDKDQLFEDVRESLAMTDEFKEGLLLWLDVNETVIPANRERATSQ